MAEDEKFVIVEPGEEQHLQEGVTPVTRAEMEGIIKDDPLPEPPLQEEEEPQPFRWQHQMRGATGPRGKLSDRSFSARKGKDMSDDIVRLPAPPDRNIFMPNISTPSPQSPLTMVEQFMMEGFAGNAEAGLDGGDGEFGKKPVHPHGWRDAKRHRKVFLEVNSISPSTPSTTWADIDLGELIIDDGADGSTRVLTPHDAGGGAYDYVAVEDNSSTNNNDLSRSSSEWLVLARTEFIFELESSPGTANGGYVQVGLRIKTSTTSYGTIYAGRVVNYGDLVIDPTAIGVTINSGTSGTIYGLNDNAMRINLSTFAILEWSDISTDGKIWIQGIEAHDGSIVWSSGVYNWANCGLTIIQFPLK